MIKEEETQKVVPFFKIQGRDLSFQLDELTPIYPSSLSNDPDPPSFPPKKWNNLFQKMFHSTTLKKRKSLGFLFESNHQKEFEKIFQLFYLPDFKNKVVFIEEK